MMSYVRESLDDSDLIIYIVEANKNQLVDESIQKILIEIDKKTLVLINKIDLVQQNEVSRIG